jgi:formylglycine-generating enzyme required for sulfatase activity
MTKVFISSTSVDLEPFREAAADAVRAAGLEPVGMEDFPAGTLPTADDCRTRVGGCKLVVALIAWRKGSVPSLEAGGDGVRSYTQIEIDHAKDNRIPVLFFLGDGDWPGRLWDRGADLEWVEEFRDSIKQIAGSFAYGGAEKLALHALKALVNNAIHDWRQNPTGPATHTDPLLAYLRQVSDEQQAYCTATGESAHATLQEVYVELSLQQEGTRQTLQKLEGLTGPGITLPTLVDKGLRQPTPLRFWLLRGDPGSGKTTVLRHLALSLAKESEHKGGAGKVPVYLPAPALSGLRAGSWQSLAAEVVSGRGPEVEKTLRRAQEEGRLVVLVDGLDEVSDPVPVQRWVGEIARDLGERGVLVVSSRFIPDRSPVPRGMERQFSFVKVELSPFGRAQRAEFLRRWHTSPWPEDDPRFAKRPWELDAAIDRIEGSPRLRELAELPLHLTLLAQQLDRGEHLSEHRMDLYVGTIRSLFRRGYRFGGPETPLDCEPKAIAVLATLAFALTDPEQAKFRRQTLIDLLADNEQCQRAWRPIESKAPWGSRAGCEAGAFLDYVSERTGLLRDVPGEPDSWQFPHRSYREALAAMVLAELTADDLLAFAQQHLAAQSTWIEPLVMAVGAHPEPDALVLALRGANPRVAWRALATAHRLKSETVAEVLALHPDDLDERFNAIGKIPDLVGDPQAAIDLLLRIGSPRPGVPHADDVYFVHEALSALQERQDVRDAATAALRLLYQRLPEVPKGDLFERIWVPHGGGQTVNLWHEVRAGTSFRMGSPETEPDRSYDEGPVHTVTFTRAYRVAVVPVTNAMFMAFDPAFVPEPWDGVSKEELPNHPVVNVSWFAATSFCRWLSTRDPARFADARLPTEAEWECAARAGTHTAYWSGDNKANLAEVGWFDANSGGRTHRVGKRTPNAWGLFDVHGNVDEWCHDWWKREYSAEAVTDPLGPPSGDHRVVRGGSWDYGAGGCRAAYLEDGNPGSRSQLRGFRVVVSAAPELGSSIMDHREEGPSRKAEAVFSAKRIQRRLRKR